MRRGGVRDKAQELGLTVLNDFEFSGLTDEDDTDCCAQRLGIWRTSARDAVGSTPTRP